MRIVTVPCLSDNYAYLVVCEKSQEAAVVDPAMAAPVAQAVANSAAKSVVGGGDSLAAINKLGLGRRIGHLSTGGGASLEYVQGLQLPGIAALER